MVTLSRGFWKLMTPILMESIVNWQHWEAWTLQEITANVMCRPFEIITQITRVATIQSISNGNIAYGVICKEKQVVIFD